MIKKYIFATILILALVLTSCGVNNNVINSTPSPTYSLAPTISNTPIATVPPTATPLKEETIRISFAGDCMFGMQNEFDLPDLFPQVYDKSKSNTYPFDNVLEYFKSDDITVINYEGTLTEKTNNAEKPWRFRGKPEYAKILKDSSVEIALVANNHAYDYLEVGYNNTIKAMSDNGVQPLGHNEIYTINVKGIEIVFIAANFILVEDDNVMSERYQSVLPLIENNKKDNNIVIVNLHWGKELQKVPPKEQQNVAHLFVDAGADLIVGHHPHLLQGIEYYNNSYIVYSLGNFAFGGSRSAVNPDTMVLIKEWKVLGDKIIDDKGYVVPCYITSTDELNYKGVLSNNFSPIPLTGEKKQKCIDLILDRSKQMPFGVESLEIK